MTTLEIVLLVAVVFLALVACIVGWLVCVMYQHFQLAVREIKLAVGNAEVNIREAILRH